MPNNNNLTDFPVFNQCVTAKCVYKNTSGSRLAIPYLHNRLFWLEGPPNSAPAQDKHMYGQCYIHSDFGLTQHRQLHALRTHMQQRKIRYGVKGVRFYTLLGVTQTTAQNIVMRNTGDVIGAWYMKTGTGTAAGTVKIDRLRNGVTQNVVAATATTSPNTTANTVKQLDIVLAGSLVEIGDTLTVVPTGGAAGTQGNVIIAVAEYND